MSPFTFNLWRFAYSPDQRHTMQEYNGWWKHLGGGLFFFTYKRTPGWV